MTQTEAIGNTKSLKISEWKQKNAPILKSTKRLKDYQSFAFKALEELYALDIPNPTDEQIHIVSALSHISGNGTWTKQVDMAAEFDCETAEFVNLGEYVEAMLKFTVSLDRINKIIGQKKISWVSPHFFSAARIRSAFGISDNQGLRALADKKTKNTARMKAWRTKKAEGITKEEKPWIALGISRAKYYRNKPAIPAIIIPEVVKSFQEQAAEITAAIITTLGDYEGDLITEALQSLAWTHKTIARTWPCHPASELTRKQNITSELLRASIALQEISTDSQAAEIMEMAKKVKTWLSDLLQSSPEVFTISNAPADKPLEWVAGDKGAMDVAIRSYLGLWLTCREMRGEFTAHISGVVCGSAQSLEAAQQIGMEWADRLFA